MEYSLKPIIIAAFLTISLVLPFSLAAQELEIILGKTQIGENEQFSITLELSGERFLKYSEFPEISGFTKQETTSGSSTKLADGKLVAMQRVTQKYRPLRQGKFRLPPFTMTANGISAQSNGAVIEVEGYIPDNSGDLFEEAWGESQREREFVEVADNAFFAITTNKSEVYVGEGFNMTISFYISLKNRATIEFHKISEQLSDILKKVQPKNAWEENFGIDQITPEYVVIKGEQYTQYKIYRATYFPLTDDLIEIPSVGLTMLKFKKAKTPSFFGRNMQEDYKTYYSAAKQVRVKPLPMHPLKNEVNVGTYQLRESVQTEQMETGRSYTFRFEIAGEGNIAAIKPAMPYATQALVVHKPTEQVKVERLGQAVKGKKVFTYQMEPRKAGTYDLGDIFSWMYFNPKTGEYETLRPTTTVTVSGEDLIDQSLNADVKADDFYNLIDAKSNQLQQLNDRGWLQGSINLALLLILGASLFIYFRSKRP